MFHDKREDLMAKQKSAEAELNSKGSQYEKGVKDYQDKASQGSDYQGNCSTDGAGSCPAAAGTCRPSR